MKNLLSTISIICLLLLITQSPSFAQSNDNQLFLVQFTKVKPSEGVNYEKEIKNFVQMISNAQVQSTVWYGSVSDDFTYMYAVPAKNFAVLDQPYWAEAVKKIGEEKFMSTVSSLNKYVENQRTEMYMLSSSLSYQHADLKGVNNTYREWTTYKFKPGSAVKVAALAKEWKDLYAKHNAKLDYQMYFSSIGVDENTVVTLDFAKNAEDLAKRETEVNKLLGEEGQKLWIKTLALLNEVDTITGEARPDLTYIPKKETVSTTKK